MCLGVPGQIREIRDERGTSMATVDFGGVTKDICLAFVPEAEVGEYTIVHAGFAITLLDEESAQETLALMRSAGMLDDELGAAETDGTR
jgi:hydrogenase expression/formation protein HypC